MSVEQGMKLRNGKIIDSVAETPLANTFIAENNDVSSQLAEIRENYEKKINDLQSDFSQLKDLMLAVLKKSDGDCHNTTAKVLQSSPRLGLIVTLLITDSASPVMLTPEYYFDNITPLKPLD